MAARRQENSGRMAGDNSFQAAYQDLIDRIELEKAPQTVGAGLNAYRQELRSKAIAINSQVGGYFESSNDLVKAAASAFFRSKSKEELKARGNMFFAEYGNIPGMVQMYKDNLERLEIHETAARLGLGGFDQLLSQQ